MATQQAQKAAPKAHLERDERDQRVSEASARRRLLAGIPVTECRLKLAGISTTTYWAVRARRSSSCMAQASRLRTGAG